MHDYFRSEGEENMFKETGSESEAGPVVSIFHHLQAITVEINLTIKVHIVECLHRNLVLASVLQPIGLVLERKVMLDWTSWESDFLIFARSHGRYHAPKSEEKGK